MRFKPRAGLIPAGDGLAHFKGEFYDYAIS